MSLSYVKLQEFAALWDCVIFDWSPCLHQWRRRVAPAFCSINGLNVTMRKRCRLWSYAGYRIFKVQETAVLL